jgi:hypothetical protein
VNTPNQPTKPIAKPASRVTVAVGLSRNILGMGVTPSILTPVVGPHVTKGITPLPTVLIISDAKNVVLVERRPKKDPVNVYNVIWVHTQTIITTMSITPNAVLVYRDNMVIYRDSAVRANPRLTTISRDQLPAPIAKIVVSSDFLSRPTKVVASVALLVLMGQRTKSMSVKDVRRGDV